MCIDEEKRTRLELTYPTFEKARKNPMSTYLFASPMQTFLKPFTRPLRLFALISRSQSSLRKPRAHAAQTTGKARGSAGEQDKRAGVTTDEAPLSRRLQRAGKLHENDVRLFDSLSPNRADLFARVLTRRTRHVTFVLDGVLGLHNVAATLRSCDAWGVQDIHLVDEPPSVGTSRRERTHRRAGGIAARLQLDQSVRNVSKNSHKWLSLHEYDSALDCVHALKEGGYKVYVSSVDPSATPLNELDISDKCAFVFGNEREGVSDDMCSRADALFTIPMVGFVESMNVSVAVATTACITVPRCQHVLPDDRFFLTDKDSQQLAKQWLLQRFQKPKPSRGLFEQVVKGDVTRLGTTAETRILKKGLFASDLTVPPPAVAAIGALAPLLRRMVLHGETGGVLRDYCKRRMYAALESKRWKRRCENMREMVSGTHALTCAAAVDTLDVVPRLERRGFRRFFKQVCDDAQARYEHFFDEYGLPNVPPSVVERNQAFRAVRKRLPEDALSCTVLFAEERFDMSETRVKEIIANANPFDVFQCLLDTARVPEADGPDCRTGFRDALATSDAFADMHIQAATQEGTGALQRMDERVVLHVALRMGQAVRLCGEMETAVWERTDDGSTQRVRSFHFGLLECVACDALADMRFAGVEETEGLLRVVADWCRPLYLLKSV